MTRGMDAMADAGHALAGGGVGTPSIQAKSSTPSAASISKIRAQFPIFAREVNGYPLAYLDSANTSQKPQVVIDAMADFVSNHNANVARAMHTLGVEASLAYEGARAKLARFIGAASAEEIVFTKNASEALNLAASTLGASLQPGDEIVVSVMEHHSNIVPWQLMAERTGAKLRWFDITSDGRLDLDQAVSSGLINERTKVVSLAWVSNVLGTVNPVAQIAEWAHRFGATVVVDGSQGVPHLATDVSVLGADLLAFTGHKMLGPTGIGVLWGRYDLLETLPPFLGGGEMIEIVRMEGSTFAPPPHRFEAGTPPIAQACGLGVAVDYLMSIGMDAIAAHEQEITGYLLERLVGIEGVTVLGPNSGVSATSAPAKGAQTAFGTHALGALGHPTGAALSGPPGRQESRGELVSSVHGCGHDERGGAVSFLLDGVHPHDLMQLLDGRGVAVRGGHHCARPLHERLGVLASTRASSYLYTTRDEVDQLIDAVLYTQEFFAPRRVTHGSS